MIAPSTEEVTERLRILHDKLEAEGAYVGSNTCYLATEAIRALRNEVDRLKYLLAEDDWA